jgi:hypothetical protein
MTEVPPDRTHDHPAGQRPGNRMSADHPGEADLELGTDDYEEPALLPRWVPVLIGFILVALAGLAVYTGMRYRTDTLTGIVRPRRAIPASQAPPGEPAPGASLVFPGDSGDNTPAARPVVRGSARAVITGTNGSIETLIRVWARRGMTLSVEPPDSVVYVNDVQIGLATQFSAQPYEFSQQGSYTVRLTAPGRRDRSFIITADERAKNEIAHVKAVLQK